ncbi:MAG TPA: hypothetical protein VFL86_15660 [Burkholderiaceae bacterium]|nr:hypothetical protein [Burkholderiaceae bacterium]
MIRLTRSRLRRVRLAEHAHIVLLAGHPAQRRPSREGAAAGSPGGSAGHPSFHWPAGFAKMMRGIEAWGWHTVPRQHLKNRALRFTQAKVIGGDSSINAQIYTRRVPADDDAWVPRAGPVAGRCRASSARKTPSASRMSFAATAARRACRTPSAPRPSAKAFFHAGQEMGIPFKPDFHGASGFLDPLGSRLDLAFKLKSRFDRASAAPDLAGADRSGSWDLENEALPVDGRRSGRLTP